MHILLASTAFSTVKPHILGWVIKAFSYGSSLCVLYERTFKSLIMERIDQD